MLISELLIRLRDMKSQHGDMPIKVADRKTVEVSVGTQGGEEGTQYHCCLITGQLDDSKKSSR